MGETIVFDFVNRRVVIAGRDGDVRPAPDDLNLVSTGASQPDDE